MKRLRSYFFKHSLFSWADGAVFVQCVLLFFDIHHASLYKSIFVHISCYVFYCDSECGSI